MAKRFTDTNKWRKQFIKSLQTVYKLLWIYITDECDHAGIWHVEKDVAEARIGEKLDIDEAKKQFNDHIIIFDNEEKWFIPSFIEFQYGQLNPTVKAHNSVISLLRKYDLLKHLPNCLQTVKDKDMDKDMDKEFKSWQDLAKFARLHHKLEFNKDKWCYEIPPYPTGVREKREHFERWKPIVDELNQTLDTL